MRLLVVAVLAVLAGPALGACNAGAPPAASPSAPPSAAVLADPGPAIDTDALLAGAAANAAKTVRVKGFLLVHHDQARLCSIVMESYPPQCGGGAVQIVGEIPADVAAGLDKTTEPGLAQAMWGWVEVTGRFDAAAGGPAIQVSEMRLAAP